MITQLRKIVAGPKNRTVCQDYDLDFTYISDTVVAMAYPASGIEKTYRNSIRDVAKYLKQKHSDYLIMNVSNRKYNYEYFDNKVLDYEWEDHQAPTLDVLFQVAYDSFAFLKKNDGANGVVCFHCNHGKGRTGTAIICLMIFCGFFSGVEQAIKFYNKRRFVGENYGVSQPCQLRYIEYFLLGLSQITNNSHSPKQVCYRISRIEIHGLKTNQYEINVSQTRCQSPILKKLQNITNILTIQNRLPIFSDIYIEVREIGWVSTKIIARANINLNYCILAHQKQFRWEMNGEMVRVSKSHHRKFVIYFYFEEFCQCHKQPANVCMCQQTRKVEEAAWQNTIRLCQERNKFEMSSREMCKLLYPSQCVEYEETQEEESIIKKEEKAMQSKEH